MSPHNIRHHIAVQWAFTNDPKEYIFRHLDIGSLCALGETCHEIHDSVNGTVFQHPHRVNYILGKKRTTEISGPEGILPMSFIYLPSNQENMHKVAYLLYNPILPTSGESHDQPLTIGIGNLYVSKEKIVTIQHESCIPKKSKLTYSSDQKGIHAYRHTDGKRVFFVGTPDTGEKKYLDCLKWDEAKQQPTITLGERINNFGIPNNTCKIHHIDANGDNNVILTFSHNRRLIFDPPTHTILQQQQPLEPWINTTSKPEAHATSLNSNPQIMVYVPIAQLAARTQDNLLRFRTLLLHENCATHQAHFVDIAVDEKSKSFNFISNRSDQICDKEGIFHSFIYNTDLIKMTRSDNLFSIESSIKNENSTSYTISWQDQTAEYMLRKSIITIDKNSQLIMTNESNYPAFYVEEDETSTPIPHIMQPPAASQSILNCLTQPFNSLLECIFQ